MPIFFFSLRTGAVSRAAMGSVCAVPGAWPCRACSMSLPAQCHNNCWILEILHRITHSGNHSIIQAGKTKPTEPSLWQIPSRDPQRCIPLFPLPSPSSPPGFWGVLQIPIIIPCHRVIRSSGDSGNYAGGHLLKEWLLSHEKLQRDKVARGGGR